MRLHNTDGSRCGDRRASGEALSDRGRLVPADRQQRDYSKRHNRQQGSENLYEDPAGHQRRQQKRHFASSVHPKVDHPFARLFNGRRRTWYDISVVAASEIARSTRRAEPVRSQLCGVCATVFDSVDDGHNLTSLPTVVRSTNRQQLNVSK